MDTRELVRKADFQLSDLTNAGLLAPAEADRFIRLAIEKSVALPLMERVDMKSHKERKAKIRYGSRVFTKGTEGEALPQNKRTKPDTSEVELDVNLIKGETRITFESARDSIERGQFVDTVRDAMAERASSDLEDLGFNGDTTSSDGLLQTDDGFLKQASTNTHDAGGASIDRKLLKDTLKTMPTEFRSNQRALRYFTADESAIDYDESIGDRGTGLGDSQVEGRYNPSFRGGDVIGVPKFPTNLGMSNDQTNILLTEPSNMLFGVWEQVEMDMDKDISARQFIIVVATRVDFLFAHESAVVKATKVAT